MPTTIGAYPYLVAPADAITFGPWELFDGDWDDLPKQLDAWDPDMTLDVRQRVEVDYESVVLAAGLPAGTKLALTASWTSSGSGMSDRFAIVLLSESGIFTLRGELRGQRVSGKLDLSTTLTLSARGQATPAPAVASIPGTILARHSSQLEIEPPTTRFPISVMDFAATKNDPNSSWRLDTSRDLPAPFFGSFLLYINSRDRDLVRALEARKPTDAQVVLLATLEEGVTALLYELALGERTSLREEDEWPENSVGAVLQTFLRIASKYGLSAPPDDVGERPAFNSRLSGLVRARARGRQFT